MKIARETKAEAYATLHLTSSELGTVQRVLERSAPRDAQAGRLWLQLFDEFGDLG